LLHYLIDSNFSNKAIYMCLCSLHLLLCVVVQFLKRFVLSCLSNLKFDFTVHLYVGVRRCEESVNLEWELNIGQVTAWLKSD